MSNQPSFISSLPLNPVHVVSYDYNEITTVQLVHDPLQKSERQESVHIEIPVAYDSGAISSIPIPVPTDSRDATTTQGKMKAWSTKGIESVDVQENAFSTDSITVGDLRKALTELVRTKACWRKGAVKGMDISVVSRSLIC